MANVLDYVDWRGDLSFEASPVNEIDRYIITVIGKPDFTGIIPTGTPSLRLSRAVEKYFENNENAQKLGVIASVNTLPLLKKLAESERFGELKLSGFLNRVIPEKTEQFSALTVRTPDGKNYVTFRGTDDTLVGWKENCELAVVDSVPAQLDAVQYLEWAALSYPGPIIVSGHSKGGNLAVYAACRASEAVQERIEEIISYDGPGFMPDFFDEGYERVKDRICAFVPHNSIVGMLLGTAAEPTVVQCGSSGVNGHDGATWSVTRAGFVRGELTNASRVFHRALDEALLGMKTEERRELVEEIFELLFSTGAFTLTDFTEQSLKKSFELAKGFTKANEIKSFIKNLIRLSIKTARGKIEG